MLCPYLLQMFYVLFMPICKNKPSEWTPNLKVFHFEKNWHYQYWKKCKWPGFKLNMNWKIHALKQIFKTFFLVICILESKFIYYAIGNYLYRLHRSILHLLQTQHRRDWEAVLNKIIHLISTCTIQYKSEFQQRLTGDHLISNEINWPDAMVYWGFLGCFSISSNSSMICENKKKNIHGWR